VSDTAAELRRLVAREHGLDDKAAGFLSGDSLDELEQSASALAKLLAGREEPESEPTPAPARGFFADGR
jgi:hypothetical protein